MPHRKKNFKRALVIGAAGGLAKLAILELLEKNPKMKIIGVDTRQSSPFKHDRYQFLLLNYTRGYFERIFREHEFDCVFHLGRMGHAANTNKLATRLDLNIIGTNTILNLCEKYTIKKVVILSTFHVYGALPDNPVYMNEDSPLRASIKYPDLRDVVEMDQLCNGWMWKNKGSISTVIFRPCNIIGPKINNAITQYLSTNGLPIGIDYNPMFQFIHESDMAQMIARSLVEVPLGVYNIAPDDTVAITEARQCMEISSLPIPLFATTLLTQFIKKNIWDIPDYLVEYLKFSVIISSKKLKEHLTDDFLQYSSRESLELLKLGMH